jgi:maltose O-acetyltransferase
VSFLIYKEKMMAARTEKEKMLAGEMYNLFDPQLLEDRQRTKQLVRLFNQTDSIAEQEEIIGQLVAKIGRDTIVEPPFFCSYGQNTYIGDHTYLNYSCTIVDNNQVRIGNYVMIGPMVQLYTAAHPLQAKQRIQGWEITKPILIEDKVWIGGGAIILPGVTIGLNAVVGAGSVVTRSVPANTVVVGNPARVIKEIEQEG